MPLNPPKLPDASGPVAAVLEVQRLVNELRDYCRRMSPEGFDLTDYEIAHREIADKLDEILG